MFDQQHQHIQTQQNFAATVMTIGGAVSTAAKAGMGLLEVAMLSAFVPHGVALFLVWRFLSNRLGLGWRWLLGSCVASLEASAIWAQHNNQTALDVARSYLPGLWGRWLIILEAVNALFSSVTDGLMQLVETPGANHTLPIHNWFGALLAAASNAYPPPPFPDIVVGGSAVSIPLSLILVAIAEFPRMQQSGSLGLRLNRADRHDRDRSPTEHRVRLERAAASLFASGLLIGASQIAVVDTTARNVTDAVMVQVDGATISARDAAGLTPTAPFCEQGHSAKFAPEFNTLKQALGDTMGESLECQHPNPDNDDTLQTTSTGLAYFRPSTNTATFTMADDEHWAITPLGPRQWSGPATDPPD